MRPLGVHVSPFFVQKSNLESDSKVPNISWGLWASLCHLFLLRSLSLKVILEVEISDETSIVHVSPYFVQKSNSEVILKLEIFHGASWCPCVTFFCSGVCL